MSADPYPERYLKGIELFNEQEYYECHEVLEDIWHESVGKEKLFYQGLIQSAVGIFHYQNSNFIGARSVVRNAHKKFVQVPDFYMGLDVAAFVAKMKKLFAGLEASGTENPAPIDESLIPTIRLEDQ